MERILVTGGTGFIGSHTCLCLLEENYEILIIDSFVNSNLNSLSCFKEILSFKNLNFEESVFIIKGDIRDEATLVNIFEESENIGKPIKAVLHFAGLKSVSDSIISPIEYWDVNVNGSINLLKVMERFECRTIVFSSSATIYALNTSRHIKEDDELDPVNPYGRTKLAVEKLLNDIYKSSPKKWRIANLRYFNPIGAHSSGLLGENPKGIPNNIFPNIMKAAINEIDKFLIYGNDYETMDGTCIRDYIHVMDLAEGHIAALKYLQNTKPTILNINLGNSNGVSVLELLKIFQKVNEVDVPFEFVNRRKGDLSVVIADNSLAISILEWEPKRTIEQMCKDGWKWAKNKS